MARPIKHARIREKTDGKFSLILSETAMRHIVGALRLEEATERPSDLSENEREALRQLFQEINENW